MAVAVVFSLVGGALPTGLLAQTDAEAALANEYYLDGEYTKALDLYARLNRQRPLVVLYGMRLVECHLGLNQPAEALSAAEKLHKRYGQVADYALLPGYVYHKSGQADKAEQAWTETLHDYTVPREFSAAGQFFLRQRLYSWAIRAYETAREQLKADQLFSRDLASLYPAVGEYEKATQEYTRMLVNQPELMPSVEAGIRRLYKPEHVAAIERGLLRAQQAHPDNLYLRELLLSFYLQAAMWQDALDQAISLDALNHEDGRRLFELAQSLQTNGEFALSNLALQEIIQQTGSPYQIKAYQETAKNYELQALANRPVDDSAVAQAVLNYDKLLERYGRRTTLTEAMYRKASLCVFYLNDLAAAKQELNQLVQLPISELEKADARLLLGDIYVIEGKALEAERAYQAVEDAFPQGQEGAKARYRLARLSYFQAEFDLAKSRLKILKDNASNDIANDALALYLKIQDNVGLDSTTAALQQFAAIELLLYQHRDAAAKPLLDSLLYRFPGHELTDDVLMKKADLAIEAGDYTLALNYFQTVVDDHRKGVLADDALFRSAELFERHLGKPEEARKRYLDVLILFPSSLYKVEARRRIRRLKEQGVQ